MLTPGAHLEEEPVDLCATTLSWMLTTSNRFLRDRATKALVNLLTDRISAVTRLVERFAENYKKTGGDVELEVFPDQPHTFAANPGPATDQAIERMKAFIARQLAV